MSLADQVRNEARTELIRVLDSVRGKKGLVVDHDLSSPLSLIAEFALLKVRSSFVLVQKELATTRTKEHGIDRIYHLESVLETECKSLIYITRPNVKNMRMIARNLSVLFLKWCKDVNVAYIEHIRVRRSEMQVSYGIYMVPRKTLICERILEEEGVFGDVIVSEFSMDMIPLEEDVLSLELYEAFADLYLRKDTSCIYSLSKAIMKLQKNNGIIPKIVGKGEFAKALELQMARMKREMHDPKDFNTYSQVIDSILILERGLDLVSPLCSQLTYEGLVDEMLGVQSTFVSVNPSYVGNTATSTQSTKPRKIPLNSSDKVFAQIRDVNFARIGSILSQNAKRLHEDYEGRHQAKTVTQIKDFVGKLGGLQSEHQALRLHTNLAEEIGKTTMDPEFNKCLEIQQNLVAGMISSTQLDTIEELIFKQSPFNTIMRLLCLYSVVNGGLKPKQYDFFRREIIHVYGYKHLLTLDNLKKVGLFRAQDANSKSNYQSIRKALRLIVDDVNEHVPNDVAYVYSGFAPILARLIQIACFKTTASIPVTLSTSGSGTASPVDRTTIKTNKHAVGWKGWEEIIRLLPGPSVEEFQKSNENLFPKRPDNDQKFTLVVFLGGCTFTEISAVRFLAQKYEGRDFLILTTNIVNGSRLVGSMVESSLLVK